MTPAVAVWQAEAAWRRLSDYLALTKPRVVAMVLVTTAVGFHLGSAESPLFLRLHHRHARCPQREDEARGEEGGTDYQMRGGHRDGASEPDRERAQRHLEDDEAGGE